MIRTASKEPFDDFEADGWEMKVGSLLEPVTPARPGHREQLRQRLLAAHSRLRGRTAADAKRSATAAGAKRVAAGTVPIAYTSVESPIGTVYVGYSRDGLCYLTWNMPDDAAVEASIFDRYGEASRRDDRLQRRAGAAVRQFLEVGRFAGKVDLSRLTEFEQRVLAKARQIPRGHVRPYGWIAREIGRPGATRAVGTALARNPIPLIIPCHRVVAGDGRIGQYSGGGPVVKTRLLSMEGVNVPGLSAMWKAGHRYQGSRTTRIYCFPTCRRIKDEHRVVFRSAEEAERQGYRPCKVCRP